MSHKGKIPTTGELRVRREVEQANRSLVGFWGTVLGLRRVGTVGILPEGDGGADLEGGSVKSGGGGGETVKPVEAAEGIEGSVAGSVKAPSSGRGSSSKSSKSSKSNKSSKSGSTSIGHKDANEEIDDAVEREAANVERATSVRSGGKASSVSDRAHDTKNTNEADGVAEVDTSPTHDGMKGSGNDRNDDTAQ